MIYLLTVNYDSADLISQLLQSLPVHCAIDYRFIIVNNSPEDGAINALKLDNLVILEAGKNLGFGIACNLGLEWIYQQDSQAIVWIINPDTCLLANSLNAAHSFFAHHSEVSILGTTIYEPNGQYWFCGGQFEPCFGIILPATQPITKSEVVYQSVEWVSGCSLLINLKNFAHCPLFDPEYFLYYEDFDFCRRYALQGHLVAITTQISVIHYPSSITSRHKNLKCQHSIYSYLLTLEKHTGLVVLCYRLARIIIVSVLMLPIYPKFAFSKLQGVWMYFQRFRQGMPGLSVK